MVDSSSSSADGSSGSYPIMHFQWNHQHIIEQVSGFPPLTKDDDSRCA